MRWLDAFNPPQDTEEEIYPVWDRPQVKVKACVKHALMGWEMIEWLRAILPLHPYNPLILLYIGII